MWLSRRKSLLGLFCSALLLLAGYSINLLKTNDFNDVTTSFLKKREVKTAEAQLCDEKNQLPFLCIGTNEALCTDLDSYYHGKTNIENTNEGNICHFESERCKTENLTNFYAYFLHKISQHEISLLEMSMENKEIAENNGQNWHSYFPKGSIFMAGHGSGSKLVDKVRYLQLNGTDGDSIANMVTTFGDNRQFDIVIDSMPAIFDDHYIAITGLLGKVKRNGFFMVENIPHDQCHMFLRMFKSNSFTGLLVKPDSSNKNNLLAVIVRNVREKGLINMPLIRSNPYITIENSDFNTCDEKSLYSHSCIGTHLEFCKFFNNLFLGDVATNKNSNELCLWINKPDKKDNYCQQEYDRDLLKLYSALFHDRRQFVEKFLYVGKTSTKILNMWSNLFSRASINYGLQSKKSDEGEGEPEEESPGGQREKIPVDLLNNATIEAMFRKYGSRVDVMIDATRPGDFKSHLNLFLNSFHKLNLQGIYVIESSTYGDCKDFFDFIKSNGLAAAMIGNGWQQTWTIVIERDGKDTLAKTSQTLKPQRPPKEDDSEWNNCNRKDDFPYYCIGTDFDRCRRFNDFYFDGKDNPSGSGSLCSVMQKVGETEKCEKHNFTIYYEFLFQNLKNSHINLMEIGVDENHPGASQKGWWKYFENGNIYSVALEKKVLVKEEERLENFFIATKTRSQIEGFFKKTFPTSKPGIYLDVIIDRSKDISFDIRIFLWRYGFLGKLLRPGGFYIVEGARESQCNQWMTVLQSQDVKASIVRTKGPDLDSVLVIFTKLR